MRLVWFKRDLRVHDHAPLLRAASQGEVVCLFVYEDELLQAPDFDPSHAVFLEQSLGELHRQLEQRGVPLVCRRGSLPQVLEELHQQWPFTSLWSHQETGNQLTYQRDLRVGRWCRQHGIDWHELPQSGVIRRLKSRDGWSRRWEERMRAGLLPAPERLQGPALVGPVLSLAELGLPPSAKPEAQPGGESAARDCLQSFLRQRGVNYAKDLSSPNTGWQGCSRLSPYLAFGNISLREVYQRTLKAALEHKARRSDPRWGRSLQAFVSRLHWRCHFIQKLEDQPDLEFHNMARSYDGLRENEFRDDYFQAWCQGKTGYPLVDACMRALLATGWINFRMRAMLMSFASYHLWLHWRPTALHLARHFLDFEAGIHYPQAQMQSGTTGINALRMYNPIKQTYDQDPQGQFLRRWLPELARVPLPYLAEPHKLPPAQRHLRQDYPDPLVDHQRATAQARARMGAVRGQHPEESRQVLQRHGSRKQGQLFEEVDSWDGALA